MQPRTLVKKDSVKGALLKAFYSFGNSLKNFCVIEFHHIKFAGFFSKIAADFIHMVILSTDLYQSCEG